MSLPTPPSISSTCWSLSPLLAQPIPAATACTNLSHSLFPTWTGPAGTAHSNPQCPSPIHCLYQFVGQKQYPGRCQHQLWLLLASSQWGSRWLRWCISCRLAQMPETCPPCWPHAASGKQGRNWCKLQKRLGCMTQKPEPSAPHEPHYMTLWLPTDRSDPVHGVYFAHPWLSLSP